MVFTRDRAERARRAVPIVPKPRTPGDGTAPSRAVHRQVGWRAVPRELAIILAGVLVYFGVRGRTEGDVDRAVDNAGIIVDAQQAVGMNIESQVQAPVAASETLTTVLNWVYIWGHWPVIAATLLWLVLRHRDAYVVTRNAMLLSGAIGMVVFALFPVAPPRLADMGLVDTVTENSRAYRVLQPPGFVNQYAAMPSLHMGWDLLVGIAIATCAGALWLRVVGWLLPALMAWAVVATANHYVLDAVAGVVLVLAARVVVVRVGRHRSRKRRARPTEAAGGA